MNHIIIGGIDKTELEDYTGAITDFTKAIEINPENADIYYNRGLAYYKNSNRKNAIQDYTKAINLKSDFAAAYLNRGTIKYETGDKNGAIPDWKKATELGNKSAKDILKQFEE